MRMPAARHVAVSRLMRSATTCPSGAESGEASTKQFCMSTFTSAVRAGTIRKSTINSPVLATADFVLPLHLEWRSLVYFLQGPLRAQKVLVGDASFACIAELTELDLG